MRYGSSLPGRRQGHRWPCKDLGSRVRSRASPFSFCSAFTVFRASLSLSLPLSLLLYPVFFVLFFRRHVIDFGPRDTPTQPQQQ
jgi:hypothetical protein